TSPVLDGPFLTWVWRLRFLRSIVLVAVGPCVRVKLGEAPVLQRARDRDRRVRARPLDTWKDNLVKARAAVAGDPLMDEIIKTAVSAALRSILINTIGNFAARGRVQTHITFDPKEVPANAPDVKQHGKAFIW
ncbi:hypothetical protein R0J90_12540, partial [Micrococcus sp. SIMBA_144]